MLEHQILAGTQNRKGRFGFLVVQAGFEPTHGDHERFYRYNRPGNCTINRLTIYLSVSAGYEIAPSLKELEPTSSGTWGRIWTNSRPCSVAVAQSRTCCAPQLPFTQFLLQVHLSLLFGLQACWAMNSQPSRHLATLLKLLAICSTLSHQCLARSADI